MGTNQEDRVESGLLLDNLIVESRNKMYAFSAVPCTELVIAGPACTGKTRFAAYAAGMLRYHFVEGDLFHLHKVMEKARNEHIPMTDEYRESEWISAIAGGLLFAALQHMEIVLTCSALKRSFRELLTSLGQQIGMGDLWIVWMDVPSTELRRRAEKRQRETNHPFGPEMIDSQLADTERPAEDEKNTLIVDGTLDPDALLRDIVERVPGLPAIGV
ncbi:MAG: gluconokinase [Planctomycetota bacterium]|nr:gluconokinase [Planctomycetota bacterium]